MKYIKSVILVILIIAIGLTCTAFAAADTQELLPDAYDLREIGTVSAVKQQESKGTDRNFAVWDASEIGILSALGQTYEEYYAKNYRYDPLKGTFSDGYETENSVIFPKLSELDENGDYVFNPEGLDAIKREIINGKGVLISYRADKTVPDPAREDTIKKYTGVYDSLGLSGAVCDNYTALKLGDKTPDDFTDEELKELIDFRFAINITSNVSYNLDSLERDDLKLLIVTPLLGYPIEQVREYAAMPSRIFINVSGENPTWAQYTDQNIEANHSAVIVGWDDDYPVSNFVLEHQPEAPGAFIVKNSWGSEWGLDGFFYLSYYDRTVRDAESRSCP